MPDRRQGDRREAEKGVLKLPFKTAVIYAVVAIVLIASLIINVLLAVKVNDYKKQLNDETLFEEDESVYEDESFESIDEDGEEEDNVIEEDNITEEDEV